MSHRILGSAGVLALAACWLGTPRQAVADVNVALGKLASSSTEAFGGSPGRAVDGNTDGNWGANSTTHTDPSDIAPFWQVDLGEEFTLTRIVLWNRTDCCAARLSNFRISILDAALGEVEGQDFFTDLSFPATPDFEYALPPGTIGQHVRVDKLGADADPNGPSTVLSLAEVQAFSDAANIAPSIITMPRGGKAFVGGSFTFTVEATGSDPLTYKWFRGVTEIPGQVNPTLTLDPVALSDDADYTVTVSNGGGDITSDPASLRVFAGRNLARDGEASQSSTGYGGTPERAIDGNTSGAYGTGTITHTGEGDPAPWWEVLLFKPSAIDYIFLWNRTDCCSQRLTNFRVLILDEDRNVEYSEDFFTDGLFPDTTIDGFEVPVPGPVNGQVVRIEHLGMLDASQAYLSLSEVEVIGQGPSPPPDPNLARRPGAEATQSSEYNGGEFPAHLAIDGALANFTHTGAGLNLPSTWEVKLTGDFDIEEIIIHNRQGCCGSRLRDITVSIYNHAGDTLKFESVLLNPENVDGAFPDGPPRISLNLFDLTGGFVNGGIVRIVREPDPDLSGTGGVGNADEMDVLSLAEVQVFTPVDCPAAGDTHCLPGSFSITGPVDGGPGAHVVDAEGTDDSGDNVRYTFTADNGKGKVLTVGPQAARQTTMHLGIGDWTVSVEVDDNARCDDKAPDAVCSQPLSIAGKPGNKAPYGIASQSTTGYEGTPDRANDGITDGNYGNASISHTADNDPEPWWEVELDADYEIDRIVLWNRTDCCPERLTNFRVSVLDDGRNEVYGEDLFTDFTFPDTFVDGFEIPLPAGVTGRIVRVALLPGGSLYLSLAEVEVFIPSGPQEICTGGADEDGDSKIDCADEDCASSPSCTGGGFHRGDSNNDGRHNISDPVNTLNVLFLGTGLISCQNAADSNDDGKVNISDPVNSLNVLFLGTGAVPPPLPPEALLPCGPDPTADVPDLGCVSYTNC